MSTLMSCAAISTKEICSNYKPMCGMWGAYLKCEFKNGCNQCECVSATGEPNYPNLK